MKLKLIKFSASWCGPCKMQTKEFEENPVNVEVEAIDIDDDNDDLSGRHNVRSIPTMILIGDDGEVLNRWTGFTKSEVINECIDVHLNT